MLPYALPQEKETILFYANLLNDGLTKEIISRDSLQSKAEAEHLAEFFWRMVDASNVEDARSGTSSEYILEKIIITFMGHFRATGYQSEWDRVADMH